MMPPVERLLLVRHGLSEANVAGVVDGQLDSHLSRLGHEQAVRTAWYLGVRYPTISAIWRSDLTRVAQTARPTEQRLAVPVTVDERLREQDIGRLSGLTRAEIDAADPGSAAAWREGRDVPVADGESMGDVASRAREALEDAISSDAGPTIAAFSHAGTIRAVIAAVLGIPMGEIRRLAAITNASVSELKVRSRGLALERISSDDHLRDPFTRTPVAPLHMSGR
jgi:broad specificity phosphatase PhoE